MSSQGIHAEHLPGHLLDDIETDCNVRQKYKAMCWKGWHYDEVHPWVRIRFGDCNRPFFNAITSIPECAHPPTVRGRCRKSCYRYVDIKIARVVDCKCRITTTRRAERCCCRRPTRCLKSCVGNIIVLKRKRFVRNGEKCTPVIEKKQFIIPCRVGVCIKTRVGKCNRRSCKRLVVRTYKKRSGCTCVSYKEKKLVTCCCPRDKSKIVCVKDTNVVRIITSYKLIKHSCMSRITKKTIRKIPRKSNIVYFVSYTVQLEVPIFCLQYITLSSLVRFILFKAAARLWPLPSATSIRSADGGTRRIIRW